MRHSRRGFLVKTGSLLGMTTVLPALTLAKPKKVAIPLEKVAKLKSVGGSTILKIKEKWILLMRTKQTEIKAVSAICTHKKCDVNYNGSLKKIECACHGSKFTTDGQVLNGPAKKNLHNYNAVLSGDKILLTMD